MLGKDIAIQPSELPTIQKGAPFKKLKMIHRKVVYLHLKAYTFSEIDLACDKNAGYASSVLRNPLVKVLLQRAYEDVDLELKALTPNAVKTLEASMRCGDPAIQLRASQEVLKLNGKYADETQGQAATAEEVVDQLWRRFDPDGTIHEKRVVRKKLLSVPVGMVSHGDAP